MTSQKRVVLLRGPENLSGVANAELTDSGELHLLLKVNGISGFFTGSSNPFTITHKSDGEISMLQGLVDRQSEIIKKLAKRLEAEKALTLAQKSMIQSFNQIQQDLDLTPKEEN